ncbi:hypothetical protein R1sor_009260 [Riccia sorocarpa]|uniref:Uncharacterized protein n=1 Tax=Riccia sorocarpa TaxID=122646 RepID=A0ABD3HWN4_9MARC
MPMGKTVVPPWVSQIGCDIIQGKRSFKYLGIWVGPETKESVGIEAAAKRIQQKIVQWDSVYLPWASRVVLLKHVLSQIPTYTMMVMGCLLKEGKKLERVCKQFLWGITSEGKVRRPFIAWKRLMRPKHQGGLGLSSFEERGTALQMRQVAAILDSKDTEWVWIAEMMMRIKLITGPIKLERRHWDAGTALLLLNTWRFAEAPTLDKICKCWFQLKKKLRLRGDRDGCAPLMEVQKNSISSKMAKRVVSENGTEIVEMMQAIDYTLSQHNTNPGVILLLGEHFRVCWNDRNKYVFEQAIGLENPRHIILAAESKCKAAWRKFSGDHAITVRQRDETFLAKARQVDQDLSSRQARIENILREAEGVIGIEEETHSVSSSSEPSSSSCESSSSKETQLSSEENSISSSHSESWKEK